MKKPAVLFFAALIILFCPLAYGKPVSQGNVVLSGNKLYVNGAEFKIKGVGYQPTPVGQGPGYNFYNQPAIYNRDFALLRNMSANAIRTWGKIQDGNFLNAAYNNGNKPIYVIMGFWVNCNEDYSNAAIRQNYINDFGSYVAAYRNYSAVLMWALGNENNLDYCATASLVDDLNSMYNEMAKKAYETEGPSYHPVAIINGDVIYLGDAAKKSDDAFLNYTDVWGMNTYPGSSLTAKINEYSALSSKPLFISEYGTDAFNNSALAENEEMQADWDAALWDEIANSPITLGGTIMEYSDEWWKFYTGVWGEDWDIHNDGGYYPSWNPASHPDSYVNEEYWGVMKVQDNGANPDIMTPRQLYYALKSRFAARSKFYLKDSNGNVISSFDDLGNAVLKGALTQSSTYAATSNDEFRFQDRNNNDVAVIDLANGNMYIDGTLSENQGSLNPLEGSYDFIIKDEDNNVVAYIDENGNLFLKGTITQNGSP